MSNLKQNGELRWIPSYLRRQGKMTPGQKKAIREDWERWGIGFRYGETIKLEDHFGTVSRYFLEIGFGMGENLVHQARRRPDSGILGIEVHKPGIGSALKLIAEEKIENVRVMRGDARLILSDYLDAMVKFDGISVLFPDPWPDPENSHRRIIQPDLLDLVESRIRPQGYFHVATDVDLYREHCETVMAGRKGWGKKIEFRLPDFRGPTRYESKGISEGREVHDLIFQWQV